MEVSFHEMELLSRSLHQAHRAAIQSELKAAGLGEVGHPMLVSILQSAGESPDGQCQAQRELADLLHISPAAVANSLKGLERDGYIRREPWQEDARRNRVFLTKKGRRCGGLSRCIPPGLRPHDGRLLAGGTGPAVSVPTPDAGQSQSPRKGVILPCFPCS